MKRKSAAIWSKRGFLIGVLALSGLCAWASFMALLAGWEPGRPAAAGYLAFLGATGVGAWILLRRIRPMEDRKESPAQPTVAKKRSSNWLVLLLMACISLVFIGAVQTATSNSLDRAAGIGVLVILVTGIGGALITGVILWRRRWERLRVHPGSNGKQHTPVLEADTVRGEPYKVPIARTIALAVAWSVCATLAILTVLLVYRIDYVTRIVSRSNVWVSWWLFVAPLVIASLVGGLVAWVVFRRANVRDKESRSLRQNIDADKSEIMHLIDEATKGDGKSV